MKLLISTVTALFLTLPSWAAVKIVGDLKVAPYKIVDLSIEGAAASAQMRWKVVGEADTRRLGNRLLFTGAPGSYKVEVLVIDFDKKQFDEAEVTVTIGEAPPPTPPGPTPPGPTPPGPGPTPPAPIPGDGLRVLILYETGELGKMTAAQRAVLYAKQVRDYLDGKCAVGPNGTTKEWRIWDKDVDASAESKTWQDALARPRTATPWIVVSNGKTGYEGPLPATVADTLTLLAKYAPATTGKKGGK